MRRFARLAVAMLLAAATGLSADDPKPTEYEVKAAFLYNFARFVDWPGLAAQDTLHIGVLGDDPFGTAFEAVLGRSSSNRPVRLRQVSDADSVGPCHILFVSASERRDLAQTLQKLAARPVLTVSDIEGFAERGGIIGFVIREQKIRFQINPGAAERAGVRLSAKLLRLAELVGEQP